jgi:hypothetical protein
MVNSSVALCKSSIRHILVDEDEESLFTINNDRDPQLTKLE